MEENMLMPHNIQSQGQLRKLLRKGAKTNQSMTLMDLNDDGDEINMGELALLANQASKLSVLDPNETTSTVPRFDYLQLKNVIDGPDDVRSRNN